MAPGRGSEPKFGLVCTLGTSSDSNRERMLELSFSPIHSKLWWTRRQVRYHRKHECVRHGARRSKRVVQTETTNTEGRLPVANMAAYQFHQLSRLLRHPQNVLLVIWEFCRPDLDSSLSLSVISVCFFFFLFYSNRAGRTVRALPPSSRCRMHAHCQVVGLTVPQVHQTPELIGTPQRSHSFRGALEVSVRLSRVLALQLLPSLWWRPQSRITKATQRLYLF